MTYRGRNNNTTLTKYIYYYLFNNLSILEKGYKGTNHKNISKEYVLNIQIPIPSMEKQMEIVETLDLFYEQIERNIQSIKAYERIKKGIVWANTTSCDNMKKLGDILNRDGIGKTNSSDIINDGEIPFYSATANNPSGFNKSFDFNGNEYFLFAKSGGNKNKIFGDNMGIGKFWLVNGKSCGNVAIIKFNNQMEKHVLNNYLKHYFNFKLYDIQKLAAYTTGNGNVNMEELNNLKIPIPSKEIQEYIVKECEYWDEQINRLKKENEKLKGVPVIEMCLAGESTKSTQTPTQQAESDDESEQEQLNEESESESEDEEPVELEIKGKTYIREGTNVYVKTKKGSKGELYGTWNETTGKVKKLTAPKEIEV
jgi:restriction endonuclease S subunit